MQPATEFRHKVHQELLFLVNGFLQLLCQSRLRTPGCLQRLGIGVSQCEVVELSLLFYDLYCESVSGG